MNKIESKITGFKVVQPSEAEAAYAKLDAAKEGVVELPPGFIVTVIKKELKRPLRLDNEWRLKPPYAEHALYVRLNAIEYEGKKYPYEIFFNTKDVTQVEWINALTLTLSIAFRTAIETGTSLQPLIDNLKETFGTRGSYLSKVPNKPKFVNGLVGEIGLTIEEFNNECLAWNYSNSSHERPATVEEKQAVLTERIPKEALVSDEAFDKWLDEPIKVTNQCSKCGEQLILMDGCLTCTGCGDSKCG